MPRWEPGQLIVRREVLGLAPTPAPEPLPAWHGRPWEALPVFVVEDSPDQLVTYIAQGAEIGFVDGDWPTPNGLHPWHGRDQWTGHGVLMVQRLGDPYAVWHFWGGPEREFTAWYLNLQADFVRTAIGYDTQDFELDFVVFPDGTWVVKDLEVLDDRVTEGRFTPSLVDWIRELGEQMRHELEAGRRWWDPSWRDWVPPSAWVNPRLPDDWAAASTTSLAAGER